jgi:hypothetical protein
MPSSQRHPRLPHEVRWRPHRAEPTAKAVPQAQTPPSLPAKRRKGKNWQFGPTKISRMSPQTVGFPKWGPKALRGANLHGLSGQVKAIAFRIKLPVDGDGSVPKFDSWVPLHTQPSSPHSRLWLRLPMDQSVSFGITQTELQICQPGTGPDHLRHPLRRTRLMSSGIEGTLELAVIGGSMHRPASKERSHAR